MSPTKISACCRDVLAQCLTKSWCRPLMSGADWKTSFLLHKAICFRHVLPAKRLHLHPLPYLPKTVQMLPMKCQAAPLAPCAAGENAVIHLYRLNNVSCKEKSLCYIVFKRHKIAVSAQNISLIERGVEVHTFRAGTEARRQTLHLLRMKGTSVFSHLGIKVPQLH